MHSSTNVNLSLVVSGGNIPWYIINNSGYSWDGITYIVYNTETCIIGANLGSYLNRAWLDDYRQGRAQSVAIHEFGHAIGMTHFTDGCVLRSIMQEFTSCRWGRLVPGVNTIQPHDQTDINAVY